MSLIIVGVAVGEKEPETKEQLGELLFFDPILSSSRKISCASCHKPAFAFADTLTVSKGVHNRKGNRNTPSSMNLRLQKTFFWDGRAKSLEEQALAPIENPKEMNLPIAKALLRLQNNSTYRYYFWKIFKSEPNRANLAEAIAAFERTLETSDSPFDNWKFTDDPRAVSDAVKRGFELFNGKAKCIRCHFGADLTANDFRNIGLFNGKEWNDSGRSVVSGKMEDVGKFKTSGLRNIAITAPYMHNGKFKTLMEVIDFYNEPDKLVPNSINRDTVLAKPMGLTRAEKEDLEAFLISLTDKRFLSN
jgi:cytochrome c peroxidase